MEDRLRIQKGFWAQTPHMLLLPVFFAVFCFVYEPFGVRDYLSGLGTLSHGVHTVLLSSILLVWMVVARSIFLALRRSLIGQWWQSWVWCLIEVVGASLFFALYITLSSKGAIPYFQAVSDSSKMLSLTLIYPYAALAAMQLLRNGETESAEKEAASDGGLMKFYDEHRRLKLTIDATAILSIGAEYNYIKVSYLDGGQVKEYTLRASMKSQEAPALAHGLVRCHRSWFVNPRHVKLLSRGEGGLFQAVLDAPAHRNVPVSKQYYDSLSSLL